ncbi:MAG: glycosyltransferase [Planctomycetota bacterium]|nr:glycosyltransferase [Planctomycetota bacterium]
MRVLMLGWEFPPFISGGLGTACHGLTRAMTRMDLEILFVLPKAITAEGEVSAASVRRRTESPTSDDPSASLTFLAVPSTVTSPYGRAMPEPTAPARLEAQPAAAPRSVAVGSQALRVVGTGAAGGYEGNLIGRIEEYAARCAEIVKDESFDVIHAHDWVTFPAGLAIAARSGKPLVVHVHSTEFDRSGEHVNQPVYEIERRGMHGAQAVIAVSERTRQTILSRYGVPAEKVRTVYNGIEPARPAPAAPNGNGEKTVLFLGRITMQKGPEFFVRAAERVLTKRNGIRFIMAGWGDLGPRTVEQVAGLGLGARVRFTGFLRGDEVRRAYRASNVYVMPSVSEPFGLTALEAIQHGVPVVLSKTSGAAEVLQRGALLVDYWDVDRMADMILALLSHPELSEAVMRNATAEVRRLTWDVAASKCVEVYEKQVTNLRN